MGFWNSLVTFIKGDNDKQLLLEEGIGKEKESIDSIESELNVYGHIVNGNVEMSVIIDGKPLVIGEWKVDPGRQTHPIDSIKEVKEAFANLKSARFSQIRGIKREILSIISEIVSNDENFILNSNSIDVIGSYCSTTLDYNEMNKLPTTIDWSSLSTEQKIAIGRQAQSRLDSLGRIQTVEDAKSDEANLVSYMQIHENAPVNPIVEANLESSEKGINLDDETIKEIAKNMESIPNEDGALYSVYLRLEEKRIWKQLQTRILEYAKVAEDKESATEVYKLSEKIKKLEGYDMYTSNGDFSYNLFEYVVNELKELNIVNYITNIKEKDFELAQKINAKCPDIQDKTEILHFLYSRMGSLGQLSCKGSTANKEILRDFIADTTFKHEDATQSHEFLVLVARIEEEHIKNKFAPAIEIYNEKTNQNESLKSRLEVGYTPTVGNNMTQYQASQTKEKQDQR